MAETVGVATAAATAAVALASPTAPAALCTPLDIIKDVTAQLHMLLPVDTALQLHGIAPHRPMCGRAATTNRLSTRGGAPSARRHGGCGEADDTDEPQSQQHSQQQQQQQQRQQQHSS
jgi:hypothetical protein